MHFSRKELLTIVVCYFCDAPQKKLITVNLAYILKQLLFMNGLKLFGENEMEGNSLILTVRILCHGIGITEFGIKNCGVLIMKRKRLIKLKRMI